MAALGFCGLGQMGEAMAARLLDAGHELTVWNRTPERAQELVARGAKQAGSPAETGASAEAVITTVSDPGALEEVLFGESGLARGLRPGTALIEMSTVGPDAVRDVAARLPDGVQMIDAPVLGSVSKATAGELLIFVGGSEEALSRYKDVLEEMGEPIHVGELGSGAAMKLVTNSVLGVLMGGLGEALALGDALGLDRLKVLDVLEESPLGKTASKKRGQIESGSYPPNFRLKLAAKDMALVTDAADKAGVELKTAKTIRQYFEAAAAAGLGELDYSALVAHITGEKAKGPDGPS